MNTLQRHCKNSFQAINITDGANLLQNQIHRSHKAIYRSWFPTERFFITYLHTQNTFRKYSHDLFLQKCRPLQLSHERGTLEPSLYCNHKHFEGTGTCYPFMGRKCKGKAR